MQPYFIPYIGYFQLMAAADVFVFYDDVNFIKKGWLRRNRILMNGVEKMVSIPCKEVSQNKLINEIIVDKNNKDFRKIKDQIKVAYANAPMKQTGYSLIDFLFDNGDNESISKFNGRFLSRAAMMLDLRVEFEWSSEVRKFNATSRQDRLMKITKHFAGSNYVNMPGGRELYSKSDFQNSDLILEFLVPRLKPYRNFPERQLGLSILDMFMYCELSEIREHALNFELD